MQLLPHSRPAEFTWQTVIEYGTRIVCLVVDLTGAGAGMYVKLRQLRCAMHTHALLDAQSMRTNLGRGRPPHQTEMMPLRMANWTNSAVLRRPRASRMRTLWTSAVRVEILSTAAISLAEAAFDDELQDFSRWREVSRDRESYAAEFPLPWDARSSPAIFGVT